MRSIFLMVILALARPSTAIACDLGTLKKAGFFTKNEITHSKCIAAGTLELYITEEVLDPKNRDDRSVNIDLFEHTGVSYKKLDSKLGLGTRLMEFLHSSNRAHLLKQTGLGSAKVDAISFQTLVPPRAGLFFTIYIDLGKRKIEFATFTEITKPALSSARKKASPQISQILTDPFRPDQTVLTKRLVTLKIPITDENGKKHTETRRYRREF